MNEPIESTERARPQSAAGSFFARLHRYQSALLERWWLLLACAVVAVGLEAANLWLQPPKFVSVGQMIVSVKLNLQQGSLYSEELGNFFGTQAALMQGTEVQNRARNRVSSQNTNLVPERVLLAVNVLPKTSIFILKATGKNPDYIKAYLQACMDEYVAFKKQMAQHTSDTTIQALSDQMLRLEPQMQKCQDEMQAYLQTNDITVLEGANGVGNYLSLLYQQLASAQSEYGLLQCMTLDQNLLLEQGRNPGYGRGGTADSHDDGGSVLMNAGLSGPGNSIGMEYLTLKQQMMLVQADQDRLSAYLKPLHPKMVSLGLETNRLGRLLDIYRQQSVEQLEAKKSALALQITNLESQIKIRGKEYTEGARKNAEYARLKAKSEHMQTLYDQLIGTMETLDVKKDISPESVTVYEPASDAYPDSPLVPKSLLLAALAGLAMGVVILLLLDRMDDRMNTFTEIQELFEEEILGQIPHERGATKSHLLPFEMKDGQMDPFIESYRSLRSSLIYMGETGQRPHTLLVTSSVPNDGKSLTAANLAITLAMSGARVLLVDADLRRGNLRSRFAVSGDTGLTEVLSEGTDWHAAVKETPVKNLRLLPRGKPTQRSSEYFISPEMKKFLQETMAEYDYVLIDTPPVMAVDDVACLAPQVDAVIFVVRARHTSARVAHAALDMLYQRKARVLGMVFNSVKAQAMDYYHYSDYKEYHKSA